MSVATATQMFCDDNSAAQIPGSVVRPLKISVKPTSATKSMNDSAGPAAQCSTLGAADPSGRPITPQLALQRFGRVLSEYEKTEILKYPKIYFVGPTAQKIRAPSKLSAGVKGARNNFGYDNEKARYKVVKHDHVAYRFEVKSALGNGSFGDVVKAYDHKEKKNVALKIIRNEKRFHDQGAIEVRLLEHLRTKDTSDKHNVIHMLDHFVFRGHLCITFEMLAGDLYGELKKGGFKGFSVERVRAAAVDLVQCLRNLRRSRLVHCDLKPENILMKSTSLKDGIKVIDFGSSCYVSERVHTYIQSRFYRAPEIVLGGEYGTPIDMWSLGCILVELLTGKPLFPAASEKELLAMQIEILGMPHHDTIVAGTRSHHHFTADFKFRPVVDRKGRTRGVSSRQLPAVLLKDENRLLRDFILQCLKWDPLKRITPRDASRHPFLIGNDAEVSPTTAPVVTRATTLPRRSSAPHRNSLVFVKPASQIQRGQSDPAVQATTDGGDTGRASLRHQSGIFKTARRRSSSIQKGTTSDSGTTALYNTMPVLKTSKRVSPIGTMASHQSLPINVNRSLKIIYNQH